MQAYRMALSIGSGQSDELAALSATFDQSLALLRTGDTKRPLSVPSDDEVRKHFMTIEQDWQKFHARWIELGSKNLTDLNNETVAFAADIDALVTSIESHMSRWTAILHVLQMGVLFLAILWAAVLLFAGYLFILEPVRQLKRGIQKIQSGDFSVRVDQVGTDEFGELAEGFNVMAAHLESLYENLESKVAEKTAELEEKHERLESLYAVTALVARATSLEVLAQDFSQHLMRTAKADGVALRWSDQTHQRYITLAASGLPNSMIEEEKCLNVGDCYCGIPTQTTRLSIIPIHALPTPSLQHCAKAGFGTIVNIPIRMQDRLMGEINLFYKEQVNPSDAERSLLEAMNSHLASAMENLRLNALEREAAVSGERHHLAGELHDSIAQSLAFLKIQVQLLRDAMAHSDNNEAQKVIEEIDTGVRESYGDVRELLMHFRTRANTEDIEPALATTLRKFEHQTGLKTTLSISGHGIPLSPDLQIQILHIVQEALSNVRKHARASHVWITVVRQPQWQFEVRDDGIGFATDSAALDETHVGLHIMQERAQRIGATLNIVSAQQVGTTVVLKLPRAAQLQND